MNKCFFGDCRETMKQLISDGIKVQTCVTSPPYWGLRDYGHEGQIGLEQTPQEYVETMVQVFRLVRDLLDNDGTLWLNLGDTYHGGGGGNYGNGLSVASGHGKHLTNVRNRLNLSGLKPKDLVGIPWRVAFALQADGWYLRSDIIWHKPNPMPESVTDRPTKSHEYIFLLSKNERYYYDADAIKEGCITDEERPYDVVRDRVCNYDSKQAIIQNRKRDAIEKRTYTGFNNRYIGLEKRNKRSVWTVTTTPYPCSHFATFPPALIEPCILAGSRSGDIVLDPFFGSGTTGQVAEQLGRKWIGCEIQQNYEKLQKDRTAQIGMILS